MRIDDLDGWAGHDGLGWRQGQAELGQILGPAVVLRIELALGIIDLVQHRPGLGERIGADGHRSTRCGAGELDGAPGFRTVDVEDSGRRPDPVVLGLARDFHDLAVLRLDLPFDAGEIHLPQIAILGSSARLGGDGEIGPGDGDLDRPALVGVFRIVDRPLDGDGNPGLHQVPGFHRAAAILVGQRQQQIPGSAKGIELKLGVLKVVAVGINENLEVIVGVDHDIALGQRCPDLRLLQFGGNVERLVVPQHLRMGAEPRHWLASPFNVGEICRPGNILPNGIVKLAIQLGRFGSLVADILAERRGIRQRRQRHHGGNQETGEESHERTPLVNG